MNTLTPLLSYSVSQVLRGVEPLAFGFSQEGHVWLVLPQPVVLGQADAGGIGNESQRVAGTNTRFRVVEMSMGQVVLDVEIDCPIDDLTSVDSFGDQFVVADSRADETHNVWIYSRHGALLHALTLGDGIQDLQVAGDGTIWTSYIDEGYLGGFAGCASLLAWDMQGRIVFRIDEIEGMHGDNDVFALNAASAQDTWFICVGALWHLHEHRVAGVWALAGGGSQAIAVEGQDVLLAGAWGAKFRMSELLEALLSDTPEDDGARMRVEDQFSAMAKLQGMGVQWGDERDQASSEFSLCWMKLHSGGNTTVEGDFVLRTGDGEPIVPTMVIGRGSRLILLAGQTMHEVTLADLISG